MNDWKSESITEVQFFSKWDWVGWLIEKVRVKQNWKSESYVSGRIDSKTGGIHNVSYTPTSESCKLSNGKKKIKKNSTLKKCNVFTHVKTLWIWESYENLCKYKLQIIEMYEKAKYCKFVSKAKIYRIFITR